MPFKRVVSCLSLLVLIFCGISWDGGSPNSGGGYLWAYSTATLRPNGVGALSQLGSLGATPNWNCVDETTPDGDSTYVDKYGSGYHYDLYNLTDFYGSGTIQSVTVYYQAHFDGQDAWGVAYLRVGTSNYSGPEQTLSADYALYSKTWNNNPSTGAAWQASELNSLQAGVGLYGYNDTDARCTQVYVVVSYTPANNVTAKLRPIGPGDLTQLSTCGIATNWKAVNESTTDDSASYVAKYGSTYFYDLYDVADFNGSGFVNSVTVKIRGDYEWGTAGWAMASIRIGGVDYYGPQEFLQDDWAVISKTWTVNPNTGLPWTIAEINALQAGVALYGGYDTLARCTQVWVEVNFDSDTPFIQVETPTNQEELLKGGEYDVTWVSNNTSSTFSVDLIDTSNQAVTPLGTLNGVGSGVNTFHWTVGSTTATGCEYEVRITPSQTPPSYSVYSPPFCIRSPYINAYVFAFDLTNASFDSDYYNEAAEFLAKCKAAGARGIRLGVCYAWKQRNELSPYHWDGLKYHLASFNNDFWNRLSILLGLMRQYGLEAWISALDGVSAKDTAQATVYPFSGAHSYETDASWDSVDKYQYCSLLFNKIIDTARASGVSFILEPMNEFPSDNDTWLRWALNDIYALRSSKQANFKIAVSKTGTFPSGYANIYDALADIISSHGVVRDSQINPASLMSAPPEVFAHSKILWSGDGGKYTDDGQTRSPSCTDNNAYQGYDNKYGLCENDAPALADAIYEGSYYGYEYMDRGVYRTNLDRMNFRITLTPLKKLVFRYLY